MRPTLLELDEARARVAGAVDPLAAVTRPVEAIRGLRLAADVAADVDLPPADVSAMDGYAAHAGDLDGETPLPVAAEVPAGRDPDPLPAGTIARIFTGAPLPPGADVVVPQEEVSVEDDGRVRLAAHSVGTHVRRRGELFAVGRVLLPAGTPVTPAALAVIAGAFGGPVPVIPRPGVAVVTTGSELVPPGSRPAPGQIRDSNGPMLRALAREADLEVRPPARAIDDLELLTRALDEALAEAELVVTAGGVSVGDHDLVPAALARLGAEVLVHGIAMRPGKPTLVARLAGRLIIGLPGNPVAAQVGWRLLVRPVAEAMAGDADAFAERPIEVHPAEPVRNPGPRLFLAPARVGTEDGRPVARLAGFKGSHDTGSTASANALVRIPGGIAEASAAPLGAYPLPWRDRWIEEAR